MGIFVAMMIFSGYVSYVAYQGEPSYELAEELRDIDAEERIRLSR